MNGLKYRAKHWNFMTDLENLFNIVGFEKFEI